MFSSVQLTSAASTNDTSTASLGSFLPSRLCHQTRVPMHVRLSQPFFNHRPTTVVAEHQPLSTVIPAERIAALTAVTVGAAVVLSPAACEAGALAWRAAQWR
jgi:hypothetical protein